MAPELSDEVKETVKATVPVLKEHGVAIITKFYSILFERYPSVQKYFNMDRQAKGRTTTDGTPSQIVSLARAVLAYAQNIDNLEVLLPTVKAICNKHVSRGVEAPHYDAVGECLIAAIGEVLGQAATPPIVDAWTKAYRFLADLFIKSEKEVYTKAAEAAGYEGFAKMIVQQIEEIENGGKEVYVLPEGGRVPNASAGQYAAIALSGVPEYDECMLTAQIKEESDSELRLTVTANGEAANSHLLSTVQAGSQLTVGMPCGKW